MVKFKGDEDEGCGQAQGHSGSSTSVSLWLLLAVEGRKLTKVGADGGHLPCRMAQWEARLI